MGVLLISGAAGGIGAALCESLARRGHTVVGGDIAPGRPPGAAATMHLDVTDAGSWAQVVAAVGERYGRLDGLVNNAGVLGVGSLLDLSPADFDAVCAVNQRGCFLGMRAAAASMRHTGGGSIVNLSSVAGLGGSADLFAYTTTKWAVRGMTRSAALELGPLGIRVNAVLPGTVAAGLADGVDDQARAEFFERLPLGRKAHPVEIADAVAYLLGPESSYLTGTDLVVDGGLSARVPMPPRLSPPEPAC
ncbi:3alpha(or 20beta)-hydroxysteroid dehydrogenase [Jatrophihabitans sp. GAS493]|uniref:SDR family NAD(P)-dependent oxidoreductase n=1 Tax=Jatrophihabitans sp. GAS493 TaxID=1907575 RepID=UPI000BB761A2|nr:SDR family oxidoreductase [Jatrophihabitans sp. GAS493]SOD71780.1 3alpha(or 20beta)-hydroxysteroid dehydrogenase [Jatrophihabitans sp. GAS493]